jgi:uncharacterized protein DUF6152
MKSNWIVLVCAMACVLLAPSLFAHHSGAMFDREKVIELKGTVKELQWSNPHIWIQVVVQENGVTKEWSLEGGSPNTLSRQGWRSTTFKPGDEVTVRLNPMKDGTAAGAFVGAKFSDGKTIGRWD